MGSDEITLETMTPGPGIVLPAKAWNAEDLAALEIELFLSHPWTPEEIFDGRQVAIDPAWTPSLEALIQRFRAKYDVYHMKERDRRYLLFQRTSKRN